jgi:hypothetical protein
VDDDQRRRWTELVQELIAQGMDEDEARFAAAVQLGVIDGDVRDKEAE